MSIYNLNPRRVVWFSPNEPLNKYDIWLSRNAHLDENGEPTTDSNSQRDCDYIFKIYDCGKWNPIVGFNTTAANKINTVASADGYQEDHVPLFGNPDNSPDELVDGGTIGDVLYEHMTASDWEHILESGGLGTAITEYSTENPFHLNYAGHQIVGGIWADEFSSSTHASGSHDDYLAQAKYKYGHGTSDYNLYVHAKDIVKIINKYTTDHNDTTLDIDFATLNDCGGILADTHSGSPNRRSGAWVKFVSTDNSTYDRTYDGAQIPQHHLAITGQQIIDTVRAWYENEYDGESIIPDDNIPDQLYSWFENSSTVLKGWQQSTGQDVANKPRFVIAGSRTAANRGKLLKLRDPDDPFWQTGEYTELNNAIEWVDPSELSTYTLEVASTTALGGIKAATHASAMLPESQVAECKFYNPSLLHQDSYKKQALCIDIKDVKNALDAWYASEDSDEWDLNLKASYGIVVRKETFTDDDNNQIVSYTHSLSNYGQFTQEGLYCRTKFYNQSTPGVQNRDYSYNDTHGLEWISGLDIIKDALNVTNSTNGFLKCTDGSFSFDQAAGGQSYPTLSSNSQSNVDYVVNGGGKAGTYLDYNGQWTVPPGTNTTYDVFTGATSNTNGSTGLVLAPTAGQQKNVLVGDKSWKPVSDVFDINMNNSVITANGNFTLNNNILSADYTGVPTDYLGTLYPWNYYIIQCNKSNTQFNFSISSARSDAGNPIYIRINTDAPMTLGGQIDYINSNNVFTGNTTLAGDSSYLITIQFEIVKIEKIASTKQVGGGSTVEPAG